MPGDTASMLRGLARVLRVSVRVACLIGLLSLAACGSGPRVPKDATVTVRILAFNDFHGQISPPAMEVQVQDPRSPAGPRIRLAVGGATYLGGLIAQLRQTSRYSIVVAAGDLIGASPLDSAMFHDEPSIEVLDTMGLEVSSVGNHEFDHGVAELERMQNGGCGADVGRTSCMRGRFKGASFRYLAANVIDLRTGKPLFPAYWIKEFPLGGGRRVRIAFVGVVTRQTPMLVVPDGVKGLKFIDEADAVNAQVRQLRARGVDAIVALIHQGGATTQKQFDDDSCPGFTGAILPIVDRLDPAVDLVISAHTHQVYICRRAGRLVTSAGAQGRFVTVIDLRVDPARRKVVSTTARQVAVVNDRLPDPIPERYPVAPRSAAAAAIVDFYTAAARSVTDRRVARGGDITRRPTPGGETALGDLVADAQLAETAGPAHAQIALINETGLRTDLRPQDGWITYGDLFAIQPFGNRLVTETLTGQQLHAVLEQQWERRGLLLQVSRGFSYQWSATAPVGARVDIRSMRLNGVPIDPAAHYRVTVNNFLADGGDGFTVLKAGTDPTYGPVDIEALKQYVAAHSPVSAVAGHRIVRRDAAQAGRAAPAGR